MERKYILTMDVGTTSVKVSLITPQLKVAYCEAVEYLLDTKGDRVEMHPAAYWTNIVQGTRRVMEEAGSCGILGISVTTQGETLIPVDETGNPLHPAIVWLDARAGRQAEQIREAMTEETFFRHTGIPTCNAYCPVSKLLWLKQERPEIYGKTGYFLLLEDYILYRLTGRFVTEKSLLSTTGYFDLETDGLWMEILTALELDGRKIPEPIECGEQAGTLMGDAADDLGVPAGVPVVTGAMDQVCAAVGVGNLCPGIVTEITGTALCIGATISKQRINVEYSVPVYRHAVPAMQLLLPVCMTGGMSLKWFKDQFCAEEAKKAREEGRDIYDVLSGLAGQSAPAAGGLIMLPYLAGMLQPEDNSSLRGAFFGMGLEHRKQDFLRSIMEGVAYMLKENLLLLQETGSLEAARLISMGGGARSPLWCQIKSDILQMPVEVREESESTSVGAAMLCAVGIGLYPSLRDIVPVKAGKSRLYVPDAGTAPLYDSAYQKYKKLVQFAREYYTLL